MQAEEEYVLAPNSSESSESQSQSQLQTEKELSAEGLELVFQRLRGGARDTVEMNLVSLMECPICFDIRLPSYQCTNGHVVCKSCWEALTIKTCPTCRVSYDHPSRTLALEKLLLECNVPIACKYAANGCTKKVCFREKQAHQDNCQFQIFACPMLPFMNCKWEGRFDEIIRHLKCQNAHSCNVISAEKAIFFFATEPESVRKPNLEIKILYCFGYYFMIAFRSVPVGDTEVEFCLTVQHVKKSAQRQDRRFAYRVELERDDTRRLIWEGETWDITSSLTGPMDEGDCLTFYNKTMNFFKTDGLGMDMVPIDVAISPK